MTLIVSAKRLALKAHAHQMYDDMPFIYHLIDVATIMECACERLRISEAQHQVLVAACWLHDLLEDTPHTYNDIVQCCNKEVADIVYAVTDECGKNRKERKERTYPKTISSDMAVCVKIADRLANASHNSSTGDSKSGMYIIEHEEFAKWFAPKPLQHSASAVLIAVLWDAYLNWYNTVKGKTNV